MSGALAEIVVVDLTTEFWASLGAALLGDFGAQVIRMETLPGGGDPHRGDGDGLPAGAWNYRHELANRNKLSMAVNPDVPRGREILQGLVGRTDVFVTDWSLSRLEGCRLDYRSLAALKPDLIYVRASGFGPKGSGHDLPPLDELAAARTGMMPVLPQPGQPPVYTGCGQMYTTVMLAFGVTAALRHRQRTGEGQEVDLSLFAGNMYGASLDIQAYLAIQGERFLHPVSRLDAGNPMSGTLYPTSDGRWVTLTMPDTDRWWPALAEVVGLDLDDSRFDSHEKRCEVNRLELIQLLDDAFRRQPADYWRAIFNERQMSADVIEDYSFPANDEQALRNRYILELERPGVGAVRMIGFPIFMSETPARLNTAAPRFGQHTSQLLQDVLGYSRDRIRKLETSGVVA